MRNEGEISRQVQRMATIDFVCLSKKISCMRPFVSWAKLLIIGLLIGGFTVSGCGNWGGKRYDPNYWHENFVSGLAGNVGQNIDDLKYSGWIDARFVVKNTLPNGYVEYTRDESREKLKRNCQYSFVVNPQTRIVVSTSWKGDHCFIVP